MVHTRVRTDCLVVSFLAPTSFPRGYEACQDCSLSLLSSPIRLTDHPNAVCPVQGRAEMPSSLLLISLDQARSFSDATVLDDEYMYKDVVLPVAPSSCEGCRSATSSLALDQGALELP
ncbi:uncharacterized protein SCHCODRAFT_01295138 [Schizophyllum commune H4-8]|uniref:uncharacterized protein n=1 Tax=Schizophyllum commune (strain H4-8 / FGSC 9210) TaxID=578458 RepID=UPI0021601117|nr:uncharacterized protein SCHCODRAFT_01295138 [Schizophyllum commune H4-8]KAI5896919.1 hypothetical protein SCHCODRAFT_01295138 [Schizophyllum commune H4-8]